MKPNPLDLRGTLYLEDYSDAAQRGETRRMRLIRIDAAMLARGQLSCVRFAPIISRQPVEARPRAPRVFELGRNTDVAWLSDHKPVVYGNWHAPPSRGWLPRAVIPRRST